MAQSAWHVFGGPPTEVVVIAVAVVVAVVVLLEAVAVAVVTVMVVVVEVVVVVVVEVMESHPLQVLSHVFEMSLHSECLKTIWHCSKENLLCLFAHRSSLLIVVLELDVVPMLVVEDEVVVVVVSH